MKKFIFGLTLCSLTTVHANAAFFSGNDLYSRMTSGETVKEVMALGFVVGVHDAFEGEYICTSNSVNAGQLRDIVKKYLAENPSIRDTNAVMITTVALGQAFPCSKKGKKS